MARDPNDFSPQTRRLLAERAGHRCSAPSCRAATSGPSATRRSEKSDAGEAAHISGARKGTARFDETLTSTERSAYENGVWLCRTHAKIIDDDADRFPNDLLVQWRDNAERMAADELGVQLSAQPQDRVLIAHCRALPLSTELIRHGVDDFLTDVGVKRAWRPHDVAVHRLLFELSVNCYKHGGATQLTIASSAGAVFLRHDGDNFGIDDLKAHGRGGHRALIDFEQHRAGALTVRHRRDGPENEWAIADEIARDASGVPCSMVLRETRDDQPARISERLAELAGCDEIHLYPGQLWSYSDYQMLLMQLAGEPVTMRFVVHGIAANDPISQMILEQDSRFRFAP
jgi:hypothetical protein